MRGRGFPPSTCWVIHINGISPQPQFAEQCTLEVSGRGFLLEGRQLGTILVGGTSRSHGGREGSSGLRTLMGGEAGL